MQDNLFNAEEKFNSFLPLLTKSYPKDRTNISFLQQLKEIYRNVQFDNNVIFALYDHRKASIFYVSDNVEKISGYKVSTIINWKGLFLFKTLHYTHYSFAFSTIRRMPPFYLKQLPEERKNIQLSVCGIKGVYANGEIRRIFLKNKTLLLDDNGIVDVSVFFMEDITHLIKGDHFWYRVSCPTDELIYIHQKGKKIFPRLLSEREKQILLLIEQKKTTNQIADLMHLSTLTIGTHRKNMLNKTGAKDTTALIHICKMANII